MDGEVVRFGKCVGCATMIFVATNGDGRETSEATLKDGEEDENKLESRASSQSARTKCRRCGNKRRWMCESRNGKKKQKRGPLVY